MEEEELEGEPFVGPAYGCPRCGALSNNWRGIKQHLRQSLRCRNTFDDLDKTKVMQKQCREAARKSCHAVRSSSLRGSEPGLETSPATDSNASLAEADASGAEAASPEDVDESGGAESREGSPPPHPKGPNDLAAGGVGGRIVAMNGRPLGVVVAEERRAWRLDGGRTVRKAAEGRKWRWDAEDASGPDCPATAGGLATDGETTAPSRTQSSSSEPSPALFQGWSPRSATASPLLLPEPFVPLTEPALGDPKAGLEPEDEEFVGVGPAACGIGAEIVGGDGRPWGLVVAEERHCWRLAQGRIAKKAMEGKRWRWAAAPAAQASPASPQRTPAREAGVYPEAVIIRTCDWLPLESALCAMWTCRDWAATLTDHVPLVMPPPQADALLQFCLLEVLVRFDDDRLPLPISAVYSEMRTAARRAASSSTARRRLEESIFRMLGPACKSQQEQFLRQRRPHHAAWSVELKTSGFKTLERLAKHFDGEKLIEIFHQRWQKRIHHTPNTRTCVEWVLTKVNRRHPLFLEHARWRLEVADAVAAEAVEAER